MAKILQKLPMWGKSFSERNSYTRLITTKLKIFILVSALIAFEGYNSQSVYAQEPSNSTQTSDNNKINIDNNPPNSSSERTPTIAVDSSNDKPRVGEPISISGSTKDAPTDTVSIDWGDGSQSETVDINHDNGNWGYLYS